MIITIGFLILMFFININLSMLFYLHMFQLNSYQALPHFNWIKAKSVKEIIFRNCWLLIPLVVCFTDHLVVLITGTVASYVVMFGVNRRKDKKEPLVYTDRITRLMATMGILNLIVGVFGITY